MFSKGDKVVLNPYEEWDSYYGIGRDSYEKLRRHLLETNGNLACIIKSTYAVNEYDDHVVEIEECIEAHSIPLLYHTSAFSKAKQEHFSKDMFEI